MGDMVKREEPVDMSSAAIAQRLRDLQQLYLFSMSLIQAQFVDKALPPTHRSEVNQESLPKTNSPEGVPTVDH
jgi:hypothetical protein